MEPLTVSALLTEFEILDRALGSPEWEELNGNKAVELRIDGFDGYVGIAMKADWGAFLFQIRCGSEPPVQFPLFTSAADLVATVNGILRLLRNAQPRDALH